MPLVQANLTSALISAMTPVESEAEAIDNLASAWESYFNGANVGAVFATPGSYGAALTSMKTALVGMSADGAAAAKIQAAISAFWTALSPIATAVWITAPIVLVPPIVPPPNIGTISAGLSGVFASNTSGNADLNSAANAVAGVLHTNGGLGATIPGSVPPTPPAPIAIL